MADRRIKARFSIALRGNCHVRFAATGLGPAGPFSDSTTAKVRRVSRPLVPAKRASWKGVKRLACDPLSTAAPVARF